ncbi:type II secretion system protein GspD [Limnohabitans sp. JirII-29]|uniref:type II secretion system secretin GspD n=1 Tax=Limnohabitans sp. JirII-29 TaxID=1835756 RepID=UPI000D3BF628|nr:type II secretion system secretin GspD [Limnohabitans sp. JirII-29]PUE29225.1 type II secretion system protein GspD [Limnohabitans sp. JirII-29]
MPKPHTHTPHSSALPWALSLALALLPALSGGSLAYAAGPAKKSAAPEPITLNFVNADIESVARTLATLSNKNLVVDPRVKGTLNLSTELPVSPAEAWAQFLAALRLQGFAVVETQGLFKVVPEADAKLQGGSVQQVDQSKASPGASGGQVVTQIFKLNFEQANNLVPVLRPLISPNNTLNVNPGNNSLVITDYADNLQRMARIIAALDVPNASDVEVIALKHAIAVDLAPLVTRLIEPSSNTSAVITPTPGQTGSDYKTTLMAEPRSNALIVRAANPARLALVRALIEKLDQPGSSNPSGNIHVVYLKNADATKLAATLRAAVSGGTGSSASPSLSTGNSSAMASQPPGMNSGTGGSSAGSSMGSTLGSSSSNASTTGGQIQADTATNSLIITAPEPQYRQLRAVIDMLDQRRAQVMVESLIAEVNASKAQQIGIQWLTAVGSSGVAGTSFGTTGNIVALSQGGTTASTASISSGLNIGTVRNINGTNVLSSLANFLQTNTDANILSTPNLLTLDNEEAKIVVGQNVPFLTGQYTSNNTATGSVNPFQTIERKDVGLTLKVKPQISETGTVKLTIFQEVSSIGTSTTSGYITNKRSIESNVLVEDGSIVVLGGLLSDEYSGNKSQVPGLGDIPGLGWLFRSDSRSRTKSNLMVFLRPVVVRDANATEALSNNRYQQMLGLQQNAQPPQNGLLDTGGAAIMPALPGSVPAATPNK